MIKIFASIAGDVIFYSARFAHDTASDALDLADDALSWAENHWDQRMWAWWKRSVR